MALTNDNAIFVWDAKRAGVPFGHMLTLGRQEFYLSSRQLDAFAREANIDGRVARGVKQKYADEFFRVFLGVNQLSAVDNSDYEGAQILHDMNLPFPNGMEETFDTVLEGGCLEHIFNFPVALANCMRALKVGGHLFLGTPANNQFGHGFYQFSPELYYRCLGPDTGFVVERLQAIEMKYLGGEFGARGRPYDVMDPARLRNRVTLTNRFPVFLMIHARKTRHLSEPFARAPQQSDYALVWNEGPGALQQTPRGRAVLRRVVRAMPRRLKDALVNEYGRLYVHTFRNRRFYKPVK